MKIKKKNWEGVLGGQVGGGGQVDVNEELNFFVKIQKKLGGGVGSRGGVGLGGVRLDVNEGLKFFCENSKKIGGGGVGSGSGWGRQGGCERRIEVFGKIHTKKKSEGGQEGGQVGGQVGGGGSGWM